MHSHLSYEGYLIDWRAHGTSAGSLLRQCELEPTHESRPALFNLHPSPPVPPIRAADLNQPVETRELKHMLSRCSAWNRGDSRDEIELYAPVLYIFHASFLRFITSIISDYVVTALSGLAEKANNSKKWQDAALTRRQLINQHKVWHNCAAAQESNTGALNTASAHLIGLLAHLRLAKKMW